MPIQKEHVQQRIDAAKANLESSWLSSDKINILQIFRALTLVKQYIDQMKGE